MSLINDALKRAKQTLNEQTPSAAGAPPLQPVEPAPKPGFWSELLLPLSLAVVLALAGIFFWRWLDQTKRPLAQTTTNAGLSITPTVRAKPVTPNPTAALASAKADSLDSSAARVAPLTPMAVGNAATALGATAGINPSAVGGTNETTNTTVAVAEPPALKLHGIFYSRKNPTAVINGKIRVVGDRIGEARLLAIGQESVTVVIGGKTNELTLP